MLPRCIFLDSEPVGLLTDAKRPPDSLAILDWAEVHRAAGNQIILPAMIDYEIRRELLRAHKTRSPALLDKLKAEGFLPLSGAALLHAAELWAQARQTGQPTAGDRNIDVDVILAAQALTFNAEEADVVVATVNTRHLTRFVNAEMWRNIAP